MKKFTNISNSVVGLKKEEKVDEKGEKINMFNHQLMRLMDDFLTIQSYGSARPELMIPTRIVGKELFIEALQDLLKQKESKEIINILESIKEKTGDWKAIDEKIDELKIDSTDKNVMKKVNEILDKWGSDVESFKIYIDNYKKKLSENKIEETLICIEKMIKSNIDEEKNSLLSIFKMSLRIGSD